MSRIPTLSRHQQHKAWIVTGVVAVLVAIACVAALGYYVFTLDSELQRETAARVASDVESKGLTEDVNALRAQVISEGEKPVVPPPGPVETSPDLTDTEVRSLALQIVQDYGVSQQAVTALVDAAVARVETTPGPPGESGPAPTPEAVMEATEAIVVPFLQANPPPPGEAGRDGVDGQDGEPGADSTVPGPQGEPGNGITESAFDETSCVLTFSYTDGTTQELGPVCGEDAFPFTIRFTVPTNGGKSVTVTCALTEATTEPQDCTTEESNPGGNP